VQRLQDEGYGAQLRAGHLLVSTPYVNAQRQVKWGYLVSTIEVIDLQNRPDIHVAYFLGETVDDYPCNSDGARLDNLIHHPGPVDLGQGLVVTCGFSQRPTAPRNDYENYYDKMSTYVGMLQAHAQAIDGTVSYRQYPPIVATPEESVFQYEDAATTHARIGTVVDKIRGQRIAIVGLGGSGSYVLDAVAKTPVGEIHLFDDDLLLIHNAFRSPGAATLDELNARPTKVAHHAAKYTGMHRHVIPHPERVTAENVQQLAGFDFVFISVDAGPDKPVMFEMLRSANIPFVDTGMGIYQRGSSIGGVVRTSASLPTQADPDWIMADGEISFVDDGDDAYAQNIQIAELNMLNAAIAVIKWKQYFGFYFDLQKECTSNYTIDGNHMLNRGATT
jgi:hypothetical protein